MNMDLKARLVLDFELLEQNLNGTTGSALHDMRKNAMQQLAELSFPTIRHEEWKYTNVMPLVGKEYQTQFAPVQEAISVDDYRIPGLDGNTLVFINGRFSAQHSTLLSQQNGVVLGSLHEAYPENKVLIESKLGGLVPAETNAFTAANTAFANDGVFALVPDNVCIEKPTYILSLIDARQANTITQPRHLFLLGANSQFKCIFRTVTIGEHHSLSNQISECYAAANARAEFISIQDDNANASVINTTQTEQEATTNIRFITLSLSGALIRNTVGTRLAGQGAEAEMYGIYFSNGNTLVDNHTVMDHAVPHCHSNELFKGILDDASQGVFNGKIFVREDAQKTLAYQSNRNILLSDRAKVNTKPQLEIFADDVKCSHGCTVGQLDEESLFYLRARGIGERKAKALLLTAFAEDITNQVSIDAVRNFVNSTIESRLLMD